MRKVAVLFVTILLTTAWAGVRTSSGAAVSGCAKTDDVAPTGTELALRMIGTPHPWAGQSGTEGAPRSGHDGKRTTDQGTEKGHGRRTQPRRDRGERSDG